MGVTPLFHARTCFLPVAHVNCMKTLLLVFLNYIFILFYCIKYLTTKKLTIPGNLEISNLKQRPSHIPPLEHMLACPLPSFLYSFFVNVFLSLFSASFSSLVSLPTILLIGTLTYIYRIECFNTSKTLISVYQEYLFLVLFVLENPTV